MQHEERKVYDKNSLETLKEIVENLTKNKHFGETKIDALEKKLTRFNETEIENEALKRQLQRLSEENDSLLVQLESSENKPDDDGSQIEMLNMQIKSMEKQCEEKAQEIKSLQDIVAKNSLKMKNLIQENSDLKDSIESQTDTMPTDQVKIKYDKCIKRLKTYRMTICDISEKLQLLKADREVLVKTTKNYSECISNWQKDLANASLKMIENITDSKKQLRLKQEEIDGLKIEIISLESENRCTNEKKSNDLKHEIEVLKKTLEEERETQRKFKEHSMKAAKKTSVLDLEMEAYEKTLDELNKKLETKNLCAIEFENTIKIQNETMESLKCQIKSLEANLESEKLHSIEVKKNLDSQLNLYRKTEHERTEANIQLEFLSKNCEALKLENVEIKLEMSKDFGALEKRYQMLESERDGNLKRIFCLESEVEKLKRLSATQEKEIEDLKSEFSSYKLRAQNVLASRQTTDFSKEQELQDEIRTLNKSHEELIRTNKKLTLELGNLQKSQNDLAEDKKRLQERCKELLETIERNSDEVLEESRKRNQSHDESLKAYQLQIDTLNVFYKKKLQESDDVQNATISELREKIFQLEKTLASSSFQTSISYDSNMFQARREDQKTNVLLMDRDSALLTRTEAEGSEDQDQSSSQSSTFQIQSRRKSSKGESRELMPLEELLNSSFDDNSNEIHEETFSNISLPSEVLEQTKAKLVREENRVTHLTSLLSESEKDLARMEQLNEMLKEEIRRQQRNVDREEHIQNSEYLKNIIIKFITLSNGDEKQRLLPVLNTILKLSSEESTLLQNACKGNGWSGLWAK